MIPIRTLIVVLLILIFIIFILGVIFTFFKGDGVGKVFYEFCKTIVGNVPIIKELFSGIFCDYMIKEV